ncbi:N-acetylmannosamine-6-phosphate 2-epimerase [Undibacterium luofuense]|uniref:N-acetylmannosamine-6-phosphate 2-epimerase n=1 Tax=Undibacterium luofuense TaxID=2828733 RepID=UPI0030EC6EC6
MKQEIQRLSGGLVVSCQPLPESPMNRPDIVVAMAAAAMQAGAAGLRIEGAEHVRLVRQALPEACITGIIKRDLTDSDVRITPFLEDVKSLASAGATIIAFDATARGRPVSIQHLFQAVKQAGCLAMADCATLADGILAWDIGCDLVGTTLSGYTAETSDQDMSAPDTLLISQLAQRGIRVMAEGRIRTPADAQRALAAGAFSVTVGSAITRIEHVTAWFGDALRELQTAEGG